MTAEQVTAFTKKIADMPLADLVGQFNAIVDDHPHHAEIGTLKEAGQLLHLIDTFAELKFGRDWNFERDAA